MVPKLITIDLDGTLLRNDCTIALTVRKAILTCLNTSKTFFVPCTGRSYQNSRFVLGDFPAFPYYINANGTTVTEGSSGTLLHAAHFLWRPDAQCILLPENTKLLSKSIMGLLLMTEPQEDRI